MTELVIRRRRYYQQETPIPGSIPNAIAAKLYGVGFTWADQFQRNEILDAYRPKIATGLAEEFLAIAGKGTSYHVPDATVAAGRRVAHTWIDAQRHIRAQHHQLQRAHLSRAFDEQQIRDFAENYAGICAAIRTKAGGDDGMAMDRCRSFADHIGVNAPAGKRVTDAGALARMADPKWWRRQLRTAWSQRAENVMRAIGIVRKGREPYASDDAVHHRAGQRRRGRRFLETHEAVNEIGEQLQLLDVVDGSVSNPAIRRAEFMTRVRGFEEIAEDAGHVAQFWTLTAPSKFHVSHYTGERNAKFAGDTVREAQAWLCKMWARSRAKLKRLSTLVYGFRIAEPHHDGTPHWHLLLFVRAKDAEQVARVIRGHWLAEDADELGARDPVTGTRPRESARAKLIEIDRRVGSAAGYVAKYVAKNIDGEGEIGAAEDWETGKDVNNGLRRVDAWASLHRIRQFQQIGGPPVGLWRELRRLTEVSEDERLEKMRAAADAGDWRAFIYAANWQGIKAGRRDLNAKLARRETGERNQYGEEKPAPLIGVQAGAHIEVSRNHDWRIVKCGTVIPSPALESSEPSASASSGERCRGSAARVGRVASLHPFGGICGLEVGASQRRYDELKFWQLMVALGAKRKPRTRGHRASQQKREPAAPSKGRASGSFSSVLFRPWTRGNNCTGPDIQQTGPPEGPTNKGGP